MGKSIGGIQEKMVVKTESREVGEGIKGHKMRGSWTSSRTLKKRALQIFMSEEGGGGSIDDERSWRWELTEEFQSGMSCLWGSEGESIRR